MTVNLENVKELDFHSNESYKTLRTNISFCGDDIKVIALTSATPNEGKSVVSFRLAKAFGEDEKKVLYIDADIRKSVFEARYGIDMETIGLSHYLAGKSELDDIIYETNLQGMHMIFTGPVVPNPSELLGNYKFEQLIQYARENYDYVIIDCPPVGSVIDAAVVARQCDGVALVIETEGVSYKMLQRVKSQMKQSGCRMLGAILNKVEVTGKYYGKYYGSAYGEYYKKDSN